MARPKLTGTTRPIQGDDAAWKREKDLQIQQLQEALKTALESIDNLTRRT